MNIQKCYHSAFKNLDIVTEGKQKLKNKTKIEPLKKTPMSFIA